jgi:hypothetical protein
MAVAGIRSVPLAVPKATYTGWNPRAPGFGPGNLYPLQGGVVPFALTLQERIKKNDPRPSIKERFVNEEAYLKAVVETSSRFIAERLLLPEDADRYYLKAKSDQLSQLN